jgi:hypothetical protein
MQVFLVEIRWTPSDVVGVVVALLTLVMMCPGSFTLLISPKTFWKRLGYEEEMDHGFVFMTQSCGGMMVGLLPIWICYIWMSGFGRIVTHFIGALYGLGGSFVYLTGILMNSEQRQKYNVKGVIFMTLMCAFLIVLNIVVGIVLTAVWNTSY